MRRFKIFLVAAAVLLGGHAASAQAEWTAGFGYASVAFNGAECSSFLSTHPMRGFYAGISREFYFSALAGLTFEPGLFYYYQSTKNELATAGQVQSGPKFIKMHYLSLPLNVKYTVEFTPAIRGAFFTGPVINAGLFGNVFENDKIFTNTSPDPMHRLTRVNAQWNLGAAFTIAEAVQLRVSYALGMSRLIPEQEIRSNTFTVGAGFLF